MTASVLSNYASSMSYPPGNHGQHSQHGQQPPQAPPPYPHQGASGGIGMYPTPPHIPPQAPQDPQHPQQGYPGVMYRPATGALPWGLGLLVLFPIPVLGALAATVAMLIAGRSARHKGPLAAANGRHAANWAITYLLLTILLIGAHVLILILIEGRGVTGFFPVGIPITLWLIVSVAHFVITVIGLFKASKNQEFRGLGMPLLR